MKTILKALVDWFLEPKRQHAAYLSIQEWERIEGITPRRVKHDWKT